MARRRFVVQLLEDRLTPSFTIHPSMSADELQQFNEARADMYAVEAARPAGSTMAPALDLTDFTAVRLDHATLAGHLNDAPQEGTTGPAKVFAVPRPDGTFDRFNVWEVQMMEPALAAEFPDIRTWRGQGIDDPTAVLAADLTSLGFHAQVIGANGTYYVDPYYHLDTSLYAAYSRDDLRNERTGRGTEDVVDLHLPELPPAPAAARPTNGQTLRTYRTAIAATGEYTQYFGGTVGAGQAAIVTAINRVSGIYETELAVRLVLVGNNSALVHTSPFGDPYSNNDAYAMLFENQARVDGTIGSGNYDIGHVFSTGGGGLAFLGVVGRNGFKAGGVTGSDNPFGDAFWVDYVAHEIGHQFGANHTFNGVNGAAFGNRHGSTAYEPGSGSTIMGYAGICDEDDIQLHSDPYFHAASLEEISNFIASGHGSGFTKTPSGNTIPTANAGPDRVVPLGTPFALTGTGTDADATDVLTYGWEQYNRGPAKSLFTGDTGRGPYFRSVEPTTGPTRSFPSTGALRTNSFGPDDFYTERAQTMKFRLTVRDNRATGAYSRDDVSVKIVNTGGPFQVTFPNTNVHLAGGSTQTVTWDVAKTNGSLIKAALVNVLLSTDGGNTFGTVLASGVPNDGTQDVVLPNLTTNTARIKVEPVGNIFFDIGNSNFRITTGPTVTAVSSPAADGKYEAGAVIPITVTYSAPVTVTGVPQILLNSFGTADYVGGSGTNTLTFQYTVAAGQSAADLDYFSTTALTLNGGNIAVGALSVARTLPEPGAAGSLAANKDLRIDTSDTASVVGVASPLANGTYGAGAVVPITVSFDRPVVVTGTPRLALNAHANAFASYVSGGGTGTLTFQYTVGLADSASDLDYASTTALTLNGGTIRSPLTEANSVLLLPAPGSAGSLAAAHDLFIGDPSISFTDATYETVEGVGTYTVTVLRIGDATGPVSVDYTVTAGTAGDGDYTVTATDTLTWADGDATPREIVFQIADDAVSEGRESIALALSGAATFGIDQAALTIRQSDGLVPGKFTDTDGDIASIALSPKTGAGSLLVYLTDGAMPVSLLETTGTDSNKTVVSVSVAKARSSTDGGLFPVGGVVGSGVKTLNLSKSPVAGAGIHLAGMVQSLTVHSLAGGADVVTTGPAIPKKKTAVAVKAGVGDGSDFVLNAPVRTFTAASVGDGRIAAPSIGSLSVKGDFAADVAVSGLGSMRVGGTVDGSAIDVAGIVGTVTVGSFRNSHLFAGYSGDDVGGGTFDPTGVVTAFTTTGRFTNSSVIAATVKTVTLTGVDGVNAGDKFGIYADSTIKSVVVKDPRRTFTNPTTLTGFDDFEIEVV